MAEKKHTRARRNELETMPNELLLGAFYTSLRTWHVFSPAVNECVLQNTAQAAVWAREPGQMMAHWQRDRL